MSWPLFCLLCIIYFQSTQSIRDTYKAGVVDPSLLRSTRTDSNSYAFIEKYLKIIQDASEQNVDILVLPITSLNDGADDDEHRSLDFGLPTPPSDNVPCGSNQYPEEISHISRAAKDARMYVTVSLPEKKYCDGNLEIFNTNFVFNRNGEIIIRHSKQVSGNPNCSVAETNRTFETDFGVSFGMLSDSDLIYRTNHESVLMKSGVKNYILYADSATYAKITSINFPSEWAYVHKVNLLVSDISNEGHSYTGVYSTKEIKPKELRSHLLTMNIQNVANQGNPTTIPSLQWIRETTLEYTEDLNSYSVELLESALTNKGHGVVLCQAGFCCDFFLKTSGQCNEHLALVVFNGVKTIGTTTIGLQTCKVIHCDDVVCDKCTVRLPKESGLIFESIRVSVNFSEYASQQYPAILTDVSSLEKNRFMFDSVNHEKQRDVSVKLTGARKLAAFGILSRDFSRDVSEMENLKLNTSQNDKEILDESYLDENQIVYFFDSLWITLRIPLFIVSIYVLEQI